MGINSFKDKDRVVSVKGLAEMEVPANKITWPLMYKDLGDDPLTLYNNINTKNKAIVAFLKSNGITQEEINIAAPEILDMKAERYTPNAPEYRNNATSVITDRNSNTPYIKNVRVVTTVNYYLKR
jgi:hypothetical protein